MTNFDTSNWQALGALLTVLGLLLSVLLWRRRGPASAVRGAAWSLLPAAAGLTGTLRLLWEVGDSVVSWAVRLVFSPVVWLGVALAALSLVLFVVSAAMRARGVGSSPSQHQKQETGALPRQRSTRKAEPAVQDEDMDDIEAILRKHGIS